MLLESKKKIEGNHAFFRDNKASIWKKCHTCILHCFVLLFKIIAALFPLKMPLAICMFILIRKQEGYYGARLNVTHA